MKKLTSAESLITINHYRNMLAAEGIRTEVRNQHLGGIMGEVPFFETWPQLWVVNDLDHDRALQLIEAADAESPAEPWRCGKCGEENEGQFSACWNCGAGADQ
jgi:membrane protease subunit (stomatin/prohibitin family)